MSSCGVVFGVDFFILRGCELDVGGVIVCICVWSFVIVFINLDWILFWMVGEFFVSFVVSFLMCCVVFRSFWVFIFWFRIIWILLIEVYMIFVVWLIIFKVMGFVSLFVWELWMVLLIWLEIVINWWVMVVSCGCSILVVVFFELRLIVD